MATLPLFSITDNDKNVEISGVDEEFQKRIEELSLQTLGGKHTVNWLGSSYSGVDIKAVAHLYQQEENPQKTMYQTTKENAEKSVQALINMLHGGLDRWVEQQIRLRSEQHVGVDPTTRLSNFSVLQDIWFDISFGASLYNQDSSQDVSIAAASQDIGSGDSSFGTPARNFMLAFFIKMMDPRGSANQFTIVKGQMTQALAVQKNLVEIATERIAEIEAIDQVGTSTQVLGTLQTISVQTHREKYGVRALGKSYVKGYTRGPRTIAGSMVFTVFNEHALTRLIKAMGSSGLYGESFLDTNISTLIPDQLPPIDITVVFANEYGSLSRMGIYGLEFINDSMRFSIEDLMTEGVMNFVARDIDIMTSVGMMKLSRIERSVYGSNDQPLTGSELLITGKTQYDEYIKRLGIRRGLVGR